MGEWQGLEKFFIAISTAFTPRLTLKRIDVINDKISKFEQYTATNILQPKQKAAVLSALDSSLAEENKILEKLKGSDRVMPSGSDIEFFIRTARRYGYITSVERPVLDELVEKIYVTKNMNASNYQQNRIVLKYKHVGVLMGICKP